MKLCVSDCATRVEERIGEEGGRGSQSCRSRVADGEELIERQGRRLTASRDTKHDDSEEALETAHDQVDDVVSA